MNKDHLEQLQRTVATLAFTRHFTMTKWAQPITHRSSFDETYACGTSLCLAGLGTMLNLAPEKKDYFPNPENLSKEDLYPNLFALEENNNRTQTTLFYVAHASQYLDIPYSDNARIWHHTYWPAPLRRLYSPQDFKGVWPYDQIDNFNPVYQAYLTARPESKVVNYNLPISYFRALSGFLALETFYRFQNVEDANWHSASQLAIGHPAKYSLPITLTRWFNYYSVKISEFEEIALNTPSAQSFLKEKTMVE